MGLDHYLASTFTADQALILRFYGWNPFCLSLGFHQQATIVRQSLLQQAGFDLVRRPTGGRAIFHADELTYSVIAGRTFLPPRKLYEFVHTMLCKALISLGYDVKTEPVQAPVQAPVQSLRQATAADFACFTRSAYSEIQFQGRKLVGSAQRIYSRSILQHGSILMGDRHEQLTGFIECSATERNRLLDEIRNKTITLNRIKSLDLSIEKIIHSIIKQLELSLSISINFNDITTAEIQATREYCIAL
jgi:lipoyl(octanoyl) transferase